MRDDTPRRFPDYRSSTPEEWQAAKRLGLERARDERARVVNALFGRLFRGLFGGVRRSAKWWRTAGADARFERRTDLRRCGEQ